MESCNVKCGTVESRRRGLLIPYTRSIIETDRQTADSLETNIFFSPAFPQLMTGMDLKTDVGPNISHCPSALQYDVNNFIFRCPRNKSP